MNKLTLRGFDDELACSIRRLAEREGLSLNQAVLKLLRKGAGLPDNVEGVGKVGSSFDNLIGTWTPAEADEMDAALEEFELFDRPEWD